jgi:hypothetical protein
MIKNKPWPVGRRIQLSLLGSLLREVPQLDAGNHHLERTKKCIETADRLTRFSLSAKRKSFYAYLNDLACGD